MDCFTDPLSQKDWKRRAKPGAACSTRSVTTPSDTRAGTARDALYIWRTIWSRVENFWRRIGDFWRVRYHTTLTECSDKLSDSVWSGRSAKATISSPIP